MREILFRGKRLDNDEWIFGDLIWADYLPSRAWISSPYDGTRLRQMDTGNKTANWRGFEVDPSTVGQYTGLKDQNGKKVVEGDVVYLERYVNGIGDFSSHYEVDFALRRYGFELVQTDGNDIMPLYCHNWQLEIIGNIHDNPELIKRNNNKNG